MSLTYGFYDSIGGDRTYNAEQLSSIFEGMIHDGVFEDIGAKLAVTATTGMNIQVGTGRAWFNQTWTKNDSNLVLSVDTAEVVLNRIDIVILEVNTAVGTRANSIKMLKGTPGSSPVAPTLTNAGTLHQYPLAHIAVGAGVTTIITANITNKIGTVDCPYVTGILRDLDTELLADLDAAFDVLSGEFTGLEAEVAPALQVTSSIATTGSANAYIVTYGVPVPLSYDNMIANVKVNFSNTGAATVNINTIGVKNLKKFAEAGKVALVTGDMIIGGLYTWMYDGTDMVVLNPTGITNGLFTATGDMMYASATRTLTRLGIDADATKMLGISGGIPAWLAFPGAKSVAGSYNGDNTSGRTISLGFTPRLILVSWVVSGGSGQFSIGHWSSSVTGANLYGSDTDSTVRTTTTTEYRPYPVANGFVVGGSGPTYLNYSTYTYYYTAVG